MGQDKLAESFEPRGTVLTHQEIRTRLQTDLVISPLLEPDQQIRDASVDIRLGTSFIVSKRPQLAHIDPSELDGRKIRKFQQKEFVPFGGTFFLHPGHLVLGCTFEFLAIPKDLSGFVLSRSSYGRIGLLVATATFVNPGWQGCLTLELENLGEVPITLRPGSRIGQLVLMTATQMAEVPLLKSIPVAPTYSTLSKDSDWAKLATLSKPPTTK
jgi:dCTP deaminase